VNVAATTLTGYTRSELLQMSVWDLTPKPHTANGITAWAAFLRTGEQSGTYTVRRKDVTVVRAAYFATAHVLPHLHLSALATTSLVRNQLHHEARSRPLATGGKRQLSARRISRPRTRR